MQATTEYDPKARELQVYWTRTLRPGDPYDDERDGFIGSECVDWRNLEPTENSVLEEIKYQQFQVNKVDRWKKDKRCDIGIAAIAYNVNITDRRCKRAIEGLEAKGRIAVERHGNSAWIIDVLHYPKEGRYGGFTVPSREPRPKSKAPTKDPETGKPISTSNHRRCAGTTVMGAPCKCYVTLGDYCHKHWEQDPLMSPQHTDPLSPQHTEPNHPYVTATEGVQIVRDMVNDSSVSVSSSVSAEMQAEIQALETPATREQKLEVNELKQRLKLTPEDIIAKLAAVSGGEIVTSWADVTCSQANALIDELAADLKFNQDVGPYGHSTAPF